MVVVGSNMVVDSAEYTNGSREKNQCMYQYVEGNSRPTPLFSSDQSLVEPEIAPLQQIGAPVVLAPSAQSVGSDTT